MSAPMSFKIVDITGQRFGRWTVLALHPQRAHSGRQAMWLCRCRCGAERILLGQSLRRGDSTSCGCFRQEVLKKRNATHRLSRTRIYRIWTNMKTRCFNPRHRSYADYGGRGITVCDRWRESFSAFYADMGDPPNRFYSLDRIDNNGNYEPDNCRWATPLMQTHNQRPRRRAA
jgi:hypothetical protein